MKTPNIIPNRLIDRYIPPLPIKFNDGTVGSAFIRLNEVLQLGCDTRGLFL
jgi:hypothetical protein